MWLTRLFQELKHEEENILYVNKWIILLNDMSE